MTAGFYVASMVSLVFVGAILACVACYLTVTILMQSRRKGRHAKRPRSEAKVVLLEEWDGVENGR